MRPGDVFEVDGRRFRVFKTAEVPVGVRRTVGYNQESFALSYVELVQRYLINRRPSDDVDGFIGPLVEEDPPDWLSAIAIEDSIPDEWGPVCP